MAGAALLFRATASLQRCRVFSTGAGDASVGFVGLGKIGYAMASNMIAAGESLVVYDTDPNAVARLVAKGGAVGATSAAEVASAASRLVTVLPNDAVLTQVVAEVAPALVVGSVHVGCSTVSPQSARSVAAIHAGLGSGYVSAPVFARPDGMAAAQASIPVSGSASDIARVLPLLQVCSTVNTPYHLSPSHASYQGLPFADPWTADVWVGLTQRRESIPPW
jgi:3-hydroxyisobutyrate dehydrogenase-like beta-hydroxyacid dehydrogenase